LAIIILQEIWESMLAWWNLQYLSKQIAAWYKDSLDEAATIDFFLLIIDVPILRALNIFSS